MFFKKSRSTAVIGNWQAMTSQFDVFDYVLRITVHAVIPKAPNRYLPGRRFVGFLQTDLS
jgi:hypothetical protein